MSQAGEYNNNSKYDPRFCKMIIEHMATGCSFATFGAIALVKFQTLKRWRKAYPEFDEACEIGELVCQLTWEKIIVGQATGEIKGVPATTIFALKNYFPDRFKENTALQGSGNTIVVFDSGVPTKQISDIKKLHGGQGEDIVDAQVVEGSSDALIRKPQELPNFLQDDVLGVDDV